MLFNSYEYLYLFLPIVLIGYYFSSYRLPKESRNIWLVLTSLFFYGFWNPIYIPLLLISVIINFYLGSLLSHNKFLPKWVTLSKKQILIIGIVLNLSALGIFKYADFFISNVNWLLKTEIPYTHLILPLAISFFTFQQIAYLVDSYKQLTHEYSFLKYTLFVTFFPQLIAGPIVHHKEIIPQYEKTSNKYFNGRNFALGIFIIFLGLVKKVGIADTFAVWANTGYSYDGMLTFFDAWTTSLAYTMQLYFDFSGYTDMAIGSALLFNISLPQNFNSPYKALDIQDFWRRWHITLSRFLRDYIYIPLGGNRYGELRLFASLFAVFLIGGFWHGASWTFIVWGALHGIAMITFRLWKTRTTYSLPKLLAWFLTFNFINITWVFFRADSFSQAFSILKSMFNFSAFNSHSVLFSSTISYIDKFQLATPELLQRDVTIAILLCIVIATLFKNSNELKKLFVLSPKFLALTIACYIIGVSYMNQFSEFLYFNF